LCKEGAWFAGISGAGRKEKIEAIRRKEVLYLEGKEFVEKNKWEGRAVDEDALLNKKVLKFIEELHGKIVKIEKHFNVAGIDKDVTASSVIENLIRKELRKK
jgi:hypothetical protein